MQGDAGPSNPSHAAAATLKVGVYQLPPTMKYGGIQMTTQTIRNAVGPNSRFGEMLQDCLLVSSFCLWAAVLGLSPVFAFHMLMGS